MLTHATIEKNTDGKRHGFVTTSFIFNGSTFEVRESNSVDFGSRSTRNRNEKKMRENLSGQCSVFCLPADADALSTFENAAVGNPIGDESFRASPEELNEVLDAVVANAISVTIGKVVDNPAKTANGVIDTLDSVSLCDAVAEEERDTKARKGILARIASRRASLVKADEIETGYAENTEPVAETDEVEVEVEVAETDDAAAEYEATVAAARKAAEKPAKKTRVEKRDDKIAFICDFYTSLFADDLKTHTPTTAASDRGVSVPVDEIPQGEQLIPNWALTFSTYWAKEGSRWHGEEASRAAGVIARLRGSELHVYPVDSDAAKEILESEANGRRYGSKGSVKVRLSEATEKVENLEAKIDAIRAMLSKGGSGVVKRTLDLCDESVNGGPEAR